MVSSSYEKSVSPESSSEAARLNQQPVSLMPSPIFHDGFLLKIFQEQVKLFVRSRTKTFFFFRTFPRFPHR